MSDLIQQLKEVEELVRSKHQPGRHDQSTHNPHKGKGGSGAIGSDKQGAAHVKSVTQALGGSFETTGKPTFGDGHWRIRGVVPIPADDVSEGIEDKVHDKLTAGLKKAGYKVRKRAADFDDSTVWEKGKVQIAVDEATSGTGGGATEGFYVLATVQESD